jgi:NADPH:quinone reductase-like Zn-dependent oxidoreductase
MVASVRVIEIRRHGRPEVLEVHDRPEPEIRPGALLVDVRAVGVNFADVLARLGMYPDAPKPPCVVGYEVAGVVVEVSAGVDGYAPGDKVIGGTVFGGYAERVVVDGRNAMPLPDHMSFEEGAAVPVNYATAWAAAVRYGAVEAGDRVLVHAAAGGVGLAAAQILHWREAEVWGTASPAKHERLRVEHVAHTVDYRSADWWRELPPFDLILDGVGGAIGRRSYRLLRPGGRLICYGVSSLVVGDKRRMSHVLRGLAATPLYSPLGHMRSSKGVIGLNMLELWKDRGTVQPWITPLRTLMAEGVIRPVIHAALPFEQAPEAHRILSDRRNVGKVVLVP